MEESIRWPASCLQATTKKFLYCMWPIDWVWEQGFRTLNTKADGCMCLEHVIRCIFIVCLYVDIFVHVLRMEMVIWWYISNMGGVSCVSLPGTHVHVCTVYSLSLCLYIKAARAAWNLDLCFDVKRYHITPLLNWLIWLEVAWKKSEVNRWQT